MWALGVRSVQLQFQDVSYSEWHCDADADTYGTGPRAAAKAQARIANALAAHLAERHPEAAPLSLMPTEYYQDGSTAYRSALSDALGERVEVAWTGVGVVPRTITGGELSTAREAFGHPMVTMDNYPVNDFAQDRIFLGPYRGREPAVATGSSALLANAMAQPLASRIPLFTAADYAWNPRAYRPAESWEAAVDDLAGGDPRACAALRALAGNDSSSVLDRTESRYLRVLIDRFWAAREVATNHGRPGRDTDLATAARKLRSAFRTMSAAPDHLNPELAAEIRPWAEQLARYGNAGAHAVDTLMAQAHDDGDAAWSAQRTAQQLRKEIAGSPATVGKGVLAPFLERAMTEADAWTGARRPTPRPDEDAEPTSLTVPFERARRIAAVTALTEPDPAAAAVSLEAHVPGEGWRRLGRLSATGWTEAHTPRLRADAVRLTWEKGTKAPAMKALTPWFQDTEAAGLELSRKEAEAQPGDRATVDAMIYSRRPADVRGKLSVRAPKGFTAHVPEQVTAPRGGTATVRVTVDVPENARSGTYEIPVEFGGAEQILTVRTYPRTGGTDLARGAVATSSGDEAPGFPASAATDGDPRTRWSSTAEDGAWLQFALAHPTRLGGSSSTGRRPTPPATGSRSHRTAAPGARRPPSATAREAGSPSGWTPRTPGSSASRATSGPPASATRCGRWRRMRWWSRAAGTSGEARTSRGTRASRAAGPGSRAASRNRAARTGKAAAERCPGAVGNRAPGAAPDRPRTEKPGPTPIRRRSGPGRHPRRTAANTAASAGHDGPYR